MARTLRKTAFWIAGPIDFAINLLINGLCPFLFLGLSGSVPLFGIPSVAIFLAPMAVCVGFFPTYFGYRNGILGNGSLPANFPWRRIALGQGILLAILSLAFMAADLAVLHFWRPDQRWSVPTLAAVDGLLSACLAYFFHATAMIRAAGLAAPEKR